MHSTEITKFKHKLILFRSALGDDRQQQRFVDHKMIRDFFLGVLSSGFLFSCTFLLFYQGLLVAGPPCQTTCQIILTQEQNGQDEIAVDEEPRTMILLLWTPLRDSFDNWQV